jgi:hypothetical protein
MWREIRAHDEAVKAVKRGADERDRAELRAMLGAELAQRGVGADPRWVEIQLDHMQMSGPERARQAAEGVKELTRIGLGVAKAIRNRKLPELPNLSVPEWIEPPEAAVYVAPQSDDKNRSWTTVNLDAGTDDWLAQVHAAVPRLFPLDESATFDGWLDWMDVPEPEPGRLAFHIGDRRVGLLDSDASALYRPVMDSAAERQELPCACARLTPRSDGGGYLLEAALPRVRDARSEAMAS